MQLINNGPPTTILKKKMQLMNNGPPNKNEKMLNRSGVFAASSTKVVQHSDHYTNQLNGLTAEHN